MKALLVFVVVILILGLLGFLFYVSGYNKAVRLDEATKTGWANVDSTLQRRLDLVPNLVETVKGYAKHEEDIFNSIASSREKYR
jgi:LemA protein